MRKSEINTFIKHIGGDPGRRAVTPGTSLLYTPNGTNGIITFLVETRGWLSKYIQNTLHNRLKDTKSYVEVDNDVCKGY